MGLKNPKRLRAVGPAFDSPPAVAFAPDGKSLAVGVREAVSIDAATGAEARRFKAEAWKGVRFTADGRLFAGGAWFDPATGTQLAARTLTPALAAVSARGTTVVMTEPADAAAVWRSAGEVLRD